MTNYGIISDIHNDPRLTHLAAEVLKNEGADKLILNGDVIENQDTIEATHLYFAIVLEAVAKTGLETFVNTGSHETVVGFEPAISYFQNKHSNIVSALQQRKVEDKDHHLVFLPGSDFS